MQGLLDCTDALGVQALLSLDRTKMHERITDKLLLLRRHQPSIQYLGISPPALIIFVMMRDVTFPVTLADAILTAVYDNRFPGDECSIVACQK